MKVWNTTRTTYKVSDFLAWQRDGSLKLNPDFQRRSVWKPGAKSYFIDSIIRGFPIPIIFLRDKKSNLQTFAPLRDVVDGQQRLRTVIAYISPALLSDYDAGRDSFTIRKVHNQEHAGKAFKDLDEDVRLQILDYQFTVNVFPSDTDDREVKQVFARMNSSGYKLNNQELRNAEYFGDFKTVAQDLANEQLYRWREWNIFSPDELARMNEVEITSELILMMLFGVTEKKDKIISAYYSQYDADFPQKHEVTKRFQQVFKIMINHFHDVMKMTFRKRTMFYALFGAIYKHQYGYGSKGVLSTKKPGTMSLAHVSAIKEYGKKVVDKLAPQSVIDASTKATAHVKTRTELINYLLSEI